MGKLLDLARKVEAVDVESPAAATVPVRLCESEWSDDEAAHLIATALGRCSYQRERAALRVRPRIEQIVKTFEPIIFRLFEQRDYDSLRFALVDLERNIDDTISGRGWN